MDLAALLAWTEPALAAVAGLARQTKTRPDQLAKHPLRRRLIRFVYRHPGANLRDITQALHLNRGTATYHLKLLEGGNLLAGLVEEHGHRFFPTGTPKDLRHRIAALRHERVLDVVMAILDEPGTAQQPLAQRLELCPTVLQGHLKLLAERRLVQTQRIGNRLAYYPTPELLEVMALLPNLGAERTGDAAP